MADTVYKLTHTGKQIDSAIDNAVRSDAQTLTTAQQTQARTNIGAASAAIAASTAALTTESNRAKAAEKAISDNVGAVANLTTTAKTVVPAINENKASIATLNQNLVPADGSITVGASWTTTLASYTIQNKRCYVSLLVTAKYDIPASSAQFTSRASLGPAYLLFNKSSGGFVSALVDTLGNISFTSKIAAGEILWCKDSYPIQ